MLLYKYRSAMGSADNDNTRRIFSSSSLYYAKASTFNDPFDAQVCSGQLIPDTTLSFSSARAGANPSLNW